MLHGHQVVEAPDADVVVIDLDYGIPPTATGRKLTVIVSARDRPRDLPPGTWFFQKPVDVEVMMDRVLDKIGAYQA